MSRNLIFGEEVLYIDKFTTVFIIVEDEKNSTHTELFIFNFFSPTDDDVLGRRGFLHSFWQTEGKKY